MKIIEKYQEEVQDLAIKSAHYIGDFAIRISFTDGTEKMVDFKPFLNANKHPEIKKYEKEERFKQFKIVNGNLDWNDFELCFPLSDLYHNTILHTESSAIS
ncbi:DUF2442 domain-containing protein [Ekhidna sp.]|uniref:DUF2442 domain-containing protein n=1 Tax=Ekhidna sp. TaxID=2608089 RepID=UPI003B5B9EFB